MLEWKNETDEGGYGVSELIEALRGDIINHSEEDAYVVPKEAAVRERLEWFRDQKLALMVHWGPYSELGICESWPLSDGDGGLGAQGLHVGAGRGAVPQGVFRPEPSVNPLRFHRTSGRTSPRASASAILSSRRSTTTASACTIPRTATTR